MEEVQTHDSTSTPKKTLEDFRVGVRDLIASLNPQESDSLEGFVSLCNHGLQNIFGGCSVIKLRKLLSDTEYVLWFIVKVHEEFVYTLIFKVLWDEESRSLRTYKKMEEADLGWLEDLNYRSFDALFDFVSSQERFDYSVLSDPKIEEGLSSFEGSLSHVADYVTSTSESSSSEEVIEMVEPKKTQRAHKPRDHHHHHQDRRLHHHHHRERGSIKKPNSSLRRKYRTYEPQTTTRLKMRGDKQNVRHYTTKRPSKRHQRPQKDHKVHKGHKTRRNHKNHRGRGLHKHKDHKDHKDHKHRHHRGSGHLSEEKPSEEKVYTSSDEIIEDIAPKEYLAKRRKEQKRDDSDSSSDLLVIQ